MSRILKFVHAETGDATHFGRDFLEEFPDAELLAPDFEVPVDDGDATEEEEPPFDPEQIREEIMAAAREEAAQKVQEAYQEGLARGTRAGEERFEATLAHCGEALLAAAEALQRSQADFVDSLEPQIVALVRMMVERVVGDEIRHNPDHLPRMARRVLARLAGEFSVTLLVHPDDLAAMKAHEVTLLDQIPGVEHLTVQASEEVEPGGCIARSDTMEVDARLDTLLAQVLDALTE